MPKDWKIHSCDVDWTERYHGSCGALKAAAQNEEVIVPPGGVYIRSKRSIAICNSEIFWDNLLVPYYACFLKYYVCFNFGFSPRFRFALIFWL